MNALIYLFRFLYRIRYWLILCPLAVAFFVYLKTSNMGKRYEVTTTVYTGIVSGYDIESDAGIRQDWNVINNAMDNLINIITSQATLKRVSMRLFAQHLMYGDPEKDNNYLQARTYRILASRTPKEVMALVDKTSEEKTLENFAQYEQASPGNYIYGLFNYTHRHYSYQALKQIKVKRMGNSDMLDVSYSADDPGVSYNTLVLLNEEFIKQYKELRFGETNNVIAYFESELDRIGGLLRIAEDSLTDYNVSKRVINYDEQTKHIASLTRDYELRYESILLDYESAQDLISTLEGRIEEHAKTFKTNTLFIQKINEISDLTTKISTLETFTGDTVLPNSASLVLRRQRDEAEEALRNLTERLGDQYYTKEGLSTAGLVNQWLDMLIRFQKAQAELKVMEDRRMHLDDQYVFFSPVGSTIKRKEREIDITERSYMAILSSLNTARLKQKSLQMTSATLKIINPPTFPIAAMPTKRKLMVMASFVATFIFILGYFILLELLDRTLRDKTRTERITSGKVLGAFPAPGKMRYRSYNNAVREIAAQYMANATVSYFGTQRPNIVNLLGVDSGEGKNFLGEQLKAQFENLDMRVRLESYRSGFNPQRKDYLLAQEYTDFLPAAEQTEDVIIIDHPPMNECSIPKAILQAGAVNLLIARTDRAWRETDQVLFDKARLQAGHAPVLIYLNMTRREATEAFTGMLPPYGRLRKLMYRFYQFGFTSSGK